ncbi:MAG: hypothetical protein ACU0GG_10470 [Paracoccaceae bacterium]
MTNLARSEPHERNAFTELLTREQPELRHLGGSQSDAWNTLVAAEASSALYLSGASKEEEEFRREAAIAAIGEICPRDEFEGMIAAQLVAAFQATMACYRRAAMEGVSLEIRRENLNQANKLSRTWTTLLEALNKHRGRSQQRVTVKHVHIQPGAQAIVGSVDARKGGDSDET